MTHPIIDIAALTVSRLREHCPGIRQVGGAAALNLAQTGLKAKPAAFVLATNERPLLNPVTAEYVQRKEHTVGIVIAVSNASDTRAEAVQGDLVSVRQQVFDALHGWMPDGCAEGLQPAASRLVRIDPAGVLWWQDDYVTTQMMRISR